MAPSEVCICNLFQQKMVHVLRNRGFQQRYQETFFKFYICLIFTIVIYTSIIFIVCKKGQVGNGQEKAQSERNSHTKNRGGKKLN